MKELVCMIGNGFNQFMNAYINHPVYQDDIRKKLQIKMVDTFTSQWLEDTKVVLNRYCHLLDDISLADNEDSGEFLLSKLAKFCDVIEDSSILDNIETAVSRKTKKEMQALTHGNYSTNIPKTIRTLCHLLDHDASMASVWYETLKQMGYRKIHFVTTNYDMIIDEVFQPENNDLDIDFIPIHGTYELDEVICSAPDKKEEKVDYSDMMAFESYVKDANRLLLFGIGLFSDPHLLKRLNTMKDKKIIIIDADQNTYFRKRNFLTNKDKGIIGFDFLFQNEIHFLDTYAFTSHESFIHPPLASPEALNHALLQVLKEDVREDRKELIVG